MKTMKTKLVNESIENHMDYMHKRSNMYDSSSSDSLIKLNKRHGLKGPLTPIQFTKFCEFLVSLNAGQLAAKLLFNIGEQHPQIRDDEFKEGREIFKQKYSNRG